MLHTGRAAKWGVCASRKLLCLNPSSPKHGISSIQHLISCDRSSRLNSWIERKRDRALLQDQGRCCSVRSPHCDPLMTANATCGNYCIHFVPSWFVSGASLCSCLCSVIEPLYNVPRHSVVVAYYLFASPYCESIQFVAS